MGMQKESVRKKLEKKGRDGKKKGVNGVLACRR